MKEQDIREIWKAGDQTKGTGMEQEQIDKIIRQGSHNVITKFIKTLKIEQHINWIIFTVLMGVAFYFGLWVWGFVILGLNALFYFYYKKLIENIDKQQTDKGVLPYLIDVHSIIKKFIRHYEVASLLLGLPGYVLSVYLVDNQIVDPMDLLHSNYIHLFGILLAISMAVLLIHVMYGRKAKKIRKMIEALKAED